MVVLMNDLDNEAPIETVTVEASRLPPLWVYAFGFTVLVIAWRLLRR